MHVHEQRCLEAMSAHLCVRKISQSYTIMVYISFQILKTLSLYNCLLQNELKEFLFPKLFLSNSYYPGTIILCVSRLQE